jgi:hypothetical protein
MKGEVGRRGDLGKGNVVRVEGGQRFGAREKTKTRQWGQPGLESITTGESDHADCVVCCLVTPSACGPFCPWTISNSTSSPSWRLL